MRPLRVLLVANDGLSAGHVVRTIAVARALSRRGPQRGIAVQLLLATTSEADALLVAAPIAVVRLPAPLAARRAGLSDRDRRRVVRGALEGIAQAFAPDLLVVDTFPSGPHGETAGLCVGTAKRVLLRRSVPRERAGDPLLMDGLADYDLAIVAADPFADEGLTMPIPFVGVPPITIGEAEGAKARAEARALLGLPPDGRVVLITSGGGGDPEARQHATTIAAAIRRVAPDVMPVHAHGPLAPRGETAPASPMPRGGIRSIHAAPLQPLLAAFDGAFSAAGYNTAHELAKAGVPAALFAEPRPFDDQAARAARFAAASLAVELRDFDDVAVASALAWMRASPRAGRVEAGGADRAADALLDHASRGVA